MTDKSRRSSIQARALAEDYKKGKKKRRRGKKIHSPSSVAKRSVNLKTASPSLSDPSIAAASSATKTPGPSPMPAASRALPAPPRKPTGFSPVVAVSDNLRRLSPGVQRRLGLGVKQLLGPVGHDAVEVDSLGGRVRHVDVAAERLGHADDGRLVARQRLL